ncbi:MAG TPA: sigma 54-interacting transcriptional regulator, partial [Isosphaeraceae bacterium]|nr:sigma 54-interacting transcriptional regulator [Isosphaeraceae bacterium]
LELLTYVRRKHREVPVILLFPRLHPERAKEALRLGAMAVLKYPVPAAELRAAVLQALELCDAKAPSEPAGQPPAATVASVTAKPATPSTTVIHDGQPPSAPRPMAINPLLSTGNSGTAGDVGGPAPSGSSLPRIEQLTREIGLIGNDPGWRQVVDLAATIASTRTSVLIVGEPGTGKSLLARLIHAIGPNSERPFITVEASALAAELSNHEPADAVYPPRGNDPQAWTSKVAQARGGTLYLDEVAAMPLEFQLNLLRDLHFRDYEASAGHPLSSGDARFLMCTSENLPALIEQGRFRQELYHRISVISLMIPPLRHRGTDVELLAESFRAHYSREFHKSVVGFTRDALEVLQKHDWPGNVRELEAAVQRAVALCSGPRITSSHLAPILNHNRQPRSGGGTMPRPHLKMGVRPLKEALEEPEKRIIIQALQAFNWNRQETAKVLDINRTTLYKKMKKYNLLIDEPVWAN